MRIHWSALAFSLAGAAALVAFWTVVLWYRPLARCPEICLVMAAGAAASVLRGRPSLHRQEPVVAAVVAWLAWLGLRTLLPRQANWGMILSYASVTGYYSAEITAGLDRIFSELLRTPGRKAPVARESPLGGGRQLWAARIALALCGLCAFLSAWQ